jgi:hypothetical protein
MREKVLKKVCQKSTEISPFRKTVLPLCNSLGGHNIPVYYNMLNQFFVEQRNVEQGGTGMVRRLASFLPDYFHRTLSRETFPSLTMVET